MKRILMLVVFAVAATSIALSQTGGDRKTKDSGNASVEQTLKQLEHEWGQAVDKKEIAALDKILADDWISLSPEGAVTKAQTLADVKSGDLKVEPVSTVEMKVRDFGAVAVVTGSEDDKSSYKGKDTSGRYTWMDVFVKRNGRWQAVASQNTLMKP
jgi:ketosteroid isomerase-like protein